jgi:4-hydroxy-3-methylbut-2-enyl diphosphate reductase
MTLVETAEDAERIAPADTATLAFLTQTTLSVDDTAEIVEILKRRFPAVVGPRGEDICYATSNRQTAVKQIAGECDALLVIGAPNSSNSLRLVEVAQREGVKSVLVQRAAELDLAWLDGVFTLGLTAGASAPEILVREVVDRLAEHFDVTEVPVAGVEERMVFKLPRELQAA